MGAISATAPNPATSAPPVLTGAPAPPPTARGAKPPQASYDLNLNVPRRNHTATVLSDRRVIFIGGENKDGALNSAELFEPAWGAISQAAATTAARTGHTATLLANGTVLVAGGSNASGTLRSTEIYDPEKNTFAPGPMLHRARAGHTATTLVDGRILVAGGDAGQSAEIFDPRARRFTVVASATTVPRRFHSAIRLQNGDVLLVGGLGFYYGDTAEIFSPATATFTPTINWLQVNRVRPRLHMLPDGKVQIIGGDRAGSMEIYAPSLNRFRNYARLSAADGELPAADVSRARTWTAIIDGAMSDDPQPTSTEPASARSPRVGGKHSAKALARADYTYSELEGLGVGVIAGGLDRQGTYLQSVLLFASSPASVTSDRVEYPLETNDVVVATDPVISGSGWWPGELVTITRQGAQSGSRVVLTAAALADGRFTIVDQPTATSGIDVYLLTAVGQTSGFVAQSTYRIAASPDRKSIEKYAGVKPTRIKARIPINGQRGTIQTDAGPLKWDVTPLNGVRFQRGTAKKKDLTASAEVTAESMLKVDTFEAVTLGDPRYDLFTFSTEWSDETLPPDWLPNPLPFTINSSGSLSGQAYLEIDSKFEGPQCHCCWCWPPCECSLASASVWAAFVIEADVSVINDFSFEIDEDTDPFLLWPFAAIKADIEGTPFKIDMSAGLYLGLNIKSTGPMVVHTAVSADNMKVKAGVEAGVALGVPPIWAGPFAEVTYDDFDVDGGLLEFHGAEIKASLLAGLKGELNLGTVPFVDCNAHIGGFVGAGPYLKLDADRATGLDPAECQKFDLLFKAGFGAQVQGGMGCGILEAGFGPYSPEFFEFTVWDPNVQFLFKDPGAPTVTPSPNITVAADAGLCTATVNVPTAATSDVCTSSTVAGDRSDGLALDAPYPGGITTITWTATDAAGNTATKDQTVTVTDTTAPVIGPVSASKYVLWPPNHTMHAVTIGYDVTDCSAYSAALSVSSNEPVNGLDDGNTVPDWEVVDPHTVMLRAERSGSGAGRVYTILVTVTDASGNPSTRTIQVAVPLDVETAAPSTDWLSALTRPRSGLLNLSR